jgi:hypothetical protein
MHLLTAADAIRVWELGQQQLPAERAVTVLAAAFPDRPKKELLRLTLGQCNARFLDVRERVFGAALNGFSECGYCGERLEFTLNSKTLRSAEPVALPDTEFTLESQGYFVRFRLLDIGDLDAASASGDVNAARTRLVERCVLEARRDNQTVTVAELPETVIADLARRLAECDSDAEVIIDLTCPFCEFKYQLPFEIASFFHMEIGAHAQRLLGEVHILARAYGWREAEILAMSARRRQSYIEMLDR